MGKTSHLRDEGRVIAAVDASAYTESVCRLAAWAASRLGAPLGLLHVINRLAETTPIDLTGNLALGEQESLLLRLSELDEQRSRLAQERGRLLLLQAQHLARHLDIDGTEVQLRHGGLVDTLVAMEDGVRLFVLGKRGENADFATGHLGGELERVARAVQRPLLVASREFKPVARILIAFDGSATTRKGVEMVAGSPLFRGLAVDVATVGEGDAAHEGLEWARQTLATAGFDANCHLVEGEPETAIATLVEKQRAGLLVMGTYGHSRIRQLIIGSTTTAMMRSCRIPVLLLR